MNTQERRYQIVKKLNESKSPIKGTTLASELDVSRQVIVQDVALLRAQGDNIIATPQGYMMLRKNDDIITKTIVCKHISHQDMEDELQIMIDYGARIIDVIVEHPIYGEIKGILDISYKHELENFMKKITCKKAEPLSSLTDGIHIHTIEVPNEECFNKLKKSLIEKGYMIDN